jgi:hypothetical protein
MEQPHSKEGADEDKEIGNEGTGDLEACAKSSAEGDIVAMGLTAGDKEIAEGHHGSSQGLKRIREEFMIDAEMQELI